ncbi:hypothetical protein TBLA_0A04060 [Henningerozyma blattae CBS 6284]|uniref:DNA-directed RNA polymerase I subunit RPA14 n=1 Tax=Henningerozyma blattae (strain ATCC 34711 / CBS 6284 / DSM 70876 / NBRC 10599 / NRRL Y-10934 / UCD 77-7) TaxID=1071380 RepID=I2GVQ0_HENB6|nr:hypothetical protein TBLA_0A04060 [Tetrapisispora blattae CBS 6284]CCH58202.1 hypothetical protein TBLA_0A04060 [Tetrapisispora blattae CBS 6284]
MLKNNKRPAFKPPTTLNTPITIHTTSSPQHVSHDEVLQFLEKFINEKETDIAGTASFSVSDITTESESGDTTQSNTIDTNLISAVSQLKRIQRDFKGLPPSMANDTFSSNSTSAQSNNEPLKSSTGGTKITFTDDE